MILVGVACRVTLFVSQKVQRLQEVSLACPGCCSLGNSYSNVIVTFTFIFVRKKNKETICSVLIGEFKQCQLSQANHLLAPAP